VITRWIRNIWCGERGRKIVLLAISTLICLCVTPSEAQPTGFGVPIKTYVGTCSNGESWALNEFDNGWFLASGPGGYFIGQDKDVLIASVCLKKM
jgi:hypothetical protein